MNPFLVDMIKSLMTCMFHVVKKSECQEKNGGFDVLLVSMILANDNYGPYLHEGIDSALAQIIKACGNDCKG